MAGKGKEGQSPDQGETVSSESLKEQQSRLGTTLRAATLGVLLSTSVQASDLLKQCDFNKNKQIDTPEMYGLKTRAEYKAADPKIKDIITKEKKCETDLSIAKGKEELAKGKEELAKGKEELAKGKEELAKGKEEYSKMIQILAMLDPKEAKKYLQDEIKKIETELKTEKNEIKIKKLTNRLETLKARLKELDKNVA